MNEEELSDASGVSGIPASLSLNSIGPITPIMRACEPARAASPPPELGAARHAAQT
eukprot:CAMPEP_0194739104 /NCGR_PEP_ID=MMETSP0296-20130528/87422_1 /TAXON_ID=39354 /ORGANISM="Heterosigma akashiwo, Strain CCMP2393" /LENGTH=55 /DNA_ID=CAMNT_0039649737 /DNA_START=252 /DNA_END=415 /DNA_ORIENTATION=+